GGAQCSHLQGVAALPVLRIPDPYVSMYLPRIVRVSSHDVLVVVDSESFAEYSSRNIYSYVLPLDQRESVKVIEVVAGTAERTYDVAIIVDPCGDRAEDARSLGLVDEGKLPTAQQEPVR